MNKKKTLYFLGCLLAASSISEVYGITPTYVTLSGRSTFSLYGVAQKSKKDRSRGYHAMVQGAQINLSVDRSSDAGIQHKLMFSINGTPSIPMGPNPPIFQQAYAELKGRVGTLQVGNVYSVPETMCLSGGSVLKGNYGYDGYLGAVFNTASKVVTGTDMVGNTGAATKFVYYTPRFGVGSLKPVFQVGVDFTPNSEHRGDAILSSNKTQVPYTQGSIYGNNMIGMGINYMDEIAENWQVQVALCRIQGKARDGRYTLHLGEFSGSSESNRYNLRPYNSWEIGALVGYKDTQFAIGYVNDGRSATQRHGVSRYPEYEQYAYGLAPRLFNIGLSHTYGPATFTLGWQRNVHRINATDKTRCKAWSSQCEYQFTDGCSSFVDINLVNHQTNQAAQDLNALEAGVDPVNRLTGYDDLVLPNNRGFVASTGFKVCF